MARLSIAVVQGGPSAEAEVSRASASAIAAALVEAGHRVVRLELGPFLPESLRTGAYDVVFPAVHGAVGEDGSLQGLLEVLDLPYVGSNVLASALAMDKRLARIHFVAAGLPVAKGIALVRGEDDPLAAAGRALREVSARLVVKPAAGGSAIGVARFDEGVTEAEIAGAIEAAWGVSPDGGVLVEHFARGREVTCGVLDRAALPPTEISSPRDAFYTYEAKYAPGRSVHVCPAPLGAALTARVQSVALAAHRALGCRDLSRVDFVVGDDGDSEAITLL
jgi:D-alanine-D-alanine ligase